MTWARCSSTPLYLRDLAKYGITANDVAAAGCYSFDLAAWRLRMHIRNDKGDLWTRAANYHSRTPQFNAVYRADLMRRASSGPIGSKRVSSPWT
jgi:hypothetical protein